MLLNSVKICNSFFFNKNVSDSDLCFSAQEKHRSLLGHMENNLVILGITYLLLFVQLTGSDKDTGKINKHFLYFLKILLALKNITNAATSSKDWSAAMYYIFILSLGTLWGVDLLKLESANSDAVLHRNQSASRYFFLSEADWLPCRAAPDFALSSFRKSTPKFTNEPIC
ncbi:hypothetical protein AB205_0137720 [Aquarana catesbeiana]|uniref:Uncharacterized protein n=1 Tax=Aquarana catesbeiana TaxID=8400 RepID=A0A2G9P836_AQUCT|nr:hypothetical protein AB205_0137720 [Aquarana catesbeiana]